MKILSIKGTNKYLERRELRKATQFMAAYLFRDNPRLFSNIELRINLVSRPGQRGEAGPIVNKLTELQDPRRFSIQIDPKYNRNNQLITLAHELVHVRQYATDRLRDLASNYTDYKGSARAYCRWRTKRGNKQWWGQDKCEQVGIWELPWEKEAYRLAPKIAKLYKQSLGDGNVK